MFDRFTKRAIEWLGARWMFFISVQSFFVWLLIGFGVKWSDQWHLWPTAILTWITWWACTLIQRSETHNTEAIHTKLDELIRAIEGARNDLIRLENASHAEVRRKHNEIS